MTSDQAKQQLSEAVWKHFNKWAAKETCIISEDSKGHEVLEYLEGDVEKYLENLFLPHQPKAVPTLTPAMIRNKIEFALATPHAHSVAVAGTFNDWNPANTFLTKGEDGIWRTKIPLSPGRHEYRFVVDGQWCDDPQAKESVVSPHGGKNGVVVV